MNLREFFLDVIFSALGNGFLFLALHFYLFSILGWAKEKYLSYLPIAKERKVRQAFDAITNTTGNNNQDALKALVVFLPIWLPLAIFTYHLAISNHSTNGEKVGSILGILTVMAFFLNKIYSQEKS